MSPLDIVGGTPPVPAGSISTAAEPELLPTWIRCTGLVMPKRTGLLPKAGHQLVPGLGLVSSWVHPRSAREISFSSQDWQHRVPACQGHQPYKGTFCSWAARWRELPLALGPIRVLSSYWEPACGHRAACLYGHHGMTYLTAHCNGPVLCSPAKLARN